MFKVKFTCEKNVITDNDNTKTRLTKDKLNPLIRVLLEMLVAPQLVRKPQSFMKPKFSLQPSHKNLSLFLP